MKRKRKMDKEVEPKYCRDEDGRLAIVYPPGTLFKKKKRG